MSFGFKYGLPLDADFVVDMRFLPNPFWVPELRAAAPARTRGRRLRAGPAGRRGVPRPVVAPVEPVLAGYRREGKRYVTIAVGCTGGKHRSVAIAEALARPAQRAAVGPSTSSHRDLGRE